MFVYLKSIEEKKPGKKWENLFNKLWPFYRKWFLSEGYKARPGYLTSYSSFEHYMPELVPIYDRLVELAGGGDLEARFLSHWCPPPYMTGCSQIAWTRNHSFLLRNYDYSPELFEGLLFKSSWIRPVIGVSDCLWGLLDGINGSGLVVSLTFGGRKITGEGFGIPIVVRYLLETCDTVEEAIQKVKLLPVHMAYNLTMLDQAGRFVTIYLSPDRPAIVNENEAIGTNHQTVVDWPDYAQMTGTVERKMFLEECLLNPNETEETLLAKFMHPPLYYTKYEKSFGTLYTSLYRPEKGEVELHWPGRKIVQSFKDFEEGKEAINLKMQVGRKLTL